MSDFGGTCEGANAVIEELKAENERLRAALEELRARGCPVDSRIARIALTEGAANRD